MLSLTRQIFAAAILLGIVSMLSTARSQTQAGKKERTGSVSGQVTINGKGAPGIVVSLSKNEIRSQSGISLRDVTDQDGNYRITGVSAGKCQVMPLAPALVIKDDRDSFNPWGKLLLIAEGETVEGIDFALMRGGVITGKVTDANGQALIEEPVTIESAESTNRPGSWNRFPRMDQQTDDRGIFRTFGLPPGRYRVAAGLSEDGSSWRTGRTTYKRTFHPNVTDRAKATIIELIEGAEATGVDITVGQAVQGFAASGRILHSETARPIANANLYLIHTVVISDNHSNRHTSIIPRSNSHGEFRVENLLPGTYLVSISTDSDLQASSVTFEVVDQDVTGLVIKTTTGASVTGTVVIESPEAEKRKADFAQLYLNAYVPGEVNEHGLGRSMGIKPDGGFRFAGLPAGLVQFAIGAYNSSGSSGYRILRIERDGIVQPNGIQMQDGEQVTGVRIFVLGDNATIRGMIKVENGSLPSGGHLFVQLTKAGERSSNLPSPQVDARGNFVIEKLAAGSYELTGTAFVPSPGSNPVFASTKQVVNLAEGAVVDVTLKIDLKQDREPRSNPNAPPSTEEKRS